MMPTKCIYLQAIVILAATANGFVCHPQPGLVQRFAKPLHATADKNKEEKLTKKPNPLTKASWYAAETLGKVFGRKQNQQAQQQQAAEEVAVVTVVESYDLSVPPASLKETLFRLKQDNEREYFLSGQMDTLIYDMDCEFSDPFVSFNGRDRFVENLANLGSFITKYSAKPLDYKEAAPSEGNTAVETKFMVKLELNLPWKPVLAWPWGVTCQIDPKTNLIVIHKESWDIDAWEGVKQVFREPTTTV